MVMIKMNEEEILLNYLKEENWKYFHEDGEPYKTISMQDRDILIKYITQLQNNWNDLKKWLEENKFNDNYESYQVDNYTTYNDILNKMQEMERGKDERSN